MAARHACPSRSSTPRRSSRCLKEQAGGIVIFSPTRVPPARNSAAPWREAQSAMEVELIRHGDCPIASRTSTWPRTLGRHHQSPALLRAVFRRRGPRTPHGSRKMNSGLPVLMAVDVPIEAVSADLSVALARYRQRIVLPPRSARAFVGTVLQGVPHYRARLPTRCQACPGARPFAFYPTELVEPCLPSWCSVKPRVISHSGQCVAIAGKAIALSMRLVSNKSCIALHFWSHGRIPVGSVVLARRKGGNPSPPVQMQISASHWGTDTVKQHSCRIGILNDSNTLPYGR